MILIALSESVLGTRGPKSMDSIYAFVNLFHAFFYMKIILLFQKFRGSWYFCRKAPIVYFNYVLVPATFKKQPQAFLKLYLFICLYFLFPITIIRHR
jgi:hypothetical protein